MKKQDSNYTNEQHHQIADTVFEWENRENRKESIGRLGGSVG